MRTHCEHYTDSFLVSPRERESEESKCCRDIHRIDCRYYLVIVRMKETQILVHDEKRERETLTLAASWCRPSTYKRKRKTTTRAL